MFLASKVAGLECRSRLRYHGHAMATRTTVDAATEAWSLALQIVFSERPPRVPAVAQEFDLSPMGLKLLYMLEPGDEPPMSHLAETLFCDASNVTGLVDRLEARGLIERRDNPRDRRVKLIALTAEGVACRARIRERLHEPPAQIAALPRADQRTLRDILRRAIGQTG
jgi:MarR family transcriptional regulator, organic hydroperoxide resistance regulator